jgi:FkbM family methyltransferase
VKLPRWLLRAARGSEPAPSLAAPQLLRAFAASYPGAFFIEIGSNDGDQHDHLRPFIESSHWRGIMVEPVPYVFRRLQRNFGVRPGLALENVAVAAHDGTMPFYFLREARPGELRTLPRWYDGIGSFSRETLLGHAQFIPDIEERLICEEIPCLTFESLCRRHDVTSLDLLLIDTEGYDAEILKLVDFQALTPALVIYEHFHMSEAARAECELLMRRAGFELMSEGFDTWCLGPSAHDQLAAVWRTLEPGVPALTAGEHR